MGTPSLFPQFLKRGAGTGGATFVRVNLDEIDFELLAEPIASLDPAEVEAQITADVEAAVEVVEPVGAVETETTAQLTDEPGGEVDC
jgi:hypothetical protein